MTIEKAIKILDPETSRDTLLSYEDGEKRLAACNEACEVAVDELRKHQWISVEDRLPEPEKEVIVFVVHENGYKTITTGMYENGKITTGDSCWHWYDLDFDYDEERDEYLVPLGWWEYRHYNPDDVYNNIIDGEVTHWMPLPEPPKEIKNEQNKN